jgi:hypothetical protein
MGSPPVSRVRPNTEAATKPTPEGRGGKPNGPHYIELRPRTVAPSSPAKPPRAVHAPPVERPTNELQKVQT